MRSAGALAISAGYGMIPPLVIYFTNAGMSNQAISILIAIYPLFKSLGYLLGSVSIFKRQSSRSILFLASVTYFGMFYFSDSWSLFLFRAIEGLLLGLYVTKQSIEISKENNATQNLAYLNSAASVGVFIGPLIVSAYLQSKHPLDSFLIPSLICFLIFIVFRGNSWTDSNSIKSKSFSSSLLSSENVSLLFTFFVFDFTYGFLSLTSSFTLTASFHENASIATAYLLTIGFIIFSIFMPIFGKMINNRNSKPLLVISLFLIAICFYAIPYTINSKLLVYSSFIAEYILASLAYCCVLSRMSNAHENIFSIGGAIQSGGMVAGPIAASILMSELSLEFTYMTLAALYALSCALSAGLLSKASSQTLPTFD
ncbi:MFS transporter [Marinomonas sp. TI.3.20]|uniref:MFS transporter n=1 Tax=Marinomonas sp. TI.3.20 TaxID=3121296 RepID=UPI00311E3850